MTTKAKERPILFNSEMILALLDGRKTQTRRVVKFGHESIGYDGKDSHQYIENETALKYGLATFHCDGDDARADNWHQCGQRCPFGFPGERLWVKERVTQLGHERTGKNGQYKWPKFESEERGHLWFGENCFYNIDYDYQDPIWDEPHGTLNKLFMPRWASRITLEITDVRVERLQEISEEDAKSEGITRDIPFVVEHENTNGPFSYHFAALWDSIYGKPLPIYERGEDGKMRIVRYESYPWSEAFRDPRQEIKGVPHVCTPNPWNWVVEFKRIDN